MSATGIDWGSLLPLLGATGASLYGASQQNGLNTAAQNAARNSQQLYNFGAGTPSGVGGAYTANPGGKGGNVGLNFGNLTGTNDQLQGLAGLFAGNAGTNQVPSALTAGANNAFGLASGNLNPANANASNFYGAANTQLQAAGQDPSQYANGVYKNLTAQAKPWEDAQTAALQDSQFGKGQAGTSGGALQTQAFAQGLGTADLQRQLSAQQLAQQQQAQSVANASNLSGAGSSILQNAFSNFNSQANQQQQLASLPAYLASLNLQNSGAALNQQAGIQNQAQSLFNTGLTTNTANGNLLIGAANQLGANANGAGTGSSPYASLLQSLFGSAANSATNSAGKGLLQQLFGGSSSAAGGEATGALGSGAIGAGALEGSGLAGSLGASTAAAESGVAADVAASNAAWLGGSGAASAGAGAGAGAAGAAGAEGAASGAAAAGAADAGASGAGAGAGATAGSLGGLAAGVGIVAAPLVAGLLTKPVALNQQWYTNIQNSLTSSSPQARIQAASQALAQPDVLRHVQIDNPQLYQQLVSGQYMKSALNAFSAAAGNHGLTRYGTQLA